ncbi:hypothetical protein D3C87_1945870 [compost metagenome]
MIGEVEADADELAGAGDAGADAVDLQFRKGGRIKSGELRQAFRRNRRAADIGDMPGKIADLAFGIENCRLFLARLANTHEFHGDMPPLV